MFKYFKKFLSVLEVGKSVDNPELWKNIQSLANIIVIFMGAVDSTLSESQTNNIGLTSAIVLTGAYNIYLTLATSKKVGIKKRK